MSSLNRILSLAKRTGGPVVIYDAESGSDFVLQSGYMYDLQNNSWESELDFTDEEDEVVIDTISEEEYVHPNQTTLFSTQEEPKEPYFAFERRTLIEEMNPSELLAQINSDIAAWKMYQDVESEVERAYALEEELIDEVEAAVQTNWHTPASIFEHYNGAMPGFHEQTARQENTFESLQTPEPYKGMRRTEKEDLQWEEEESTWSELQPVQEVAAPLAPSGEIRIEEVPFDAPMVESVGESEPLIDSDAPVFYTEPAV